MPLPPTTGTVPLEEVSVTATGGGLMAREVTAAGGAMTVNALLNLTGGGMCAETHMTQAGGGIPIGAMIQVAAASSIAGIFHLDNTQPPGVSIPVRGALFGRPAATINCLYKLQISCARDCQWPGGVLHHLVRQAAT